MKRRIAEQARRGRMRVIGGQPGGDEPVDRPERHGRQRHGQAGQNRLPQSERGPGIAVLRWSVRANVG